MGKQEDWQEVNRHLAQLDIYDAIARDRRLNHGMDGEIEAVRGGLSIADSVARGGEDDSPPDPPRGGQRESSGGVFDGLAFLAVGAVGVLSAAYTVTEVVKALRRKG